MPALRYTYIENLNIHKVPILLFLDTGWKLKKASLEVISKKTLMLSSTIICKWLS